MEFKVVCHVYNLCIHIWAVTACGVRLAVVNLGEYYLDWCGCVLFAFHAFLIVDEVVWCYLDICMEEVFDESSCSDACVPCVAFFLNLDVLIVYVGEKLLFEYSVVVRRAS